MTNKRPFNDQFNMELLNIDFEKEFLTYLNQPESCELFYIYMKTENLAYVLEFYLACDGLKNLFNNKKKQINIIQLIYKYYLSNGKYLSSSKKFSLTNHLLYSIKQRLIKREFNIKFYDQAQEYVLKYMLQMCYPKFLIEQQNLPNTKRQAISKSAVNSMYRRSISTRKKDMFDKFKQQSTTVINLNSLETSTLITDNEIGLNNSKQLRVKKLTKQEKEQYSLAEHNPAAFFEEIKRRLLIYQTGIYTLSQSFNIDKKNQMIDDDPSAILDLQIAKTINDDDNYLFETTKIFTRSDSGVGTDISEKNYKTCSYSSPKKQCLSIDVIWYPSLDSNNTLLSTIPYIHNELTFKEFRQLFKKQRIYRYFFKTICTSDINKDQYIFKELTMDDELVPFYNGKIFVQLDRIF